jgi:hypothetical protein
MLNDEELWEALALDEEPEEPEPERGDFWDQDDDEEAEP